MSDVSPDEAAPEGEGPAEEAPTIGLTDKMVRKIEAALDDGNLRKVEKRLARLHSADVADLLERLNKDDRETVVDIIRPQLQVDAEILTHLDEDVREQIFERLEPAEIAGAMVGLDSDDALDLIEDLDDEDREEILASMPAAERLQVEQGLTFPEDSAGRLMQREFVAVPMFWTVGKSIDYLRTAEDLPDDFYALFAVDPSYKPVGTAVLSRVLRSKRSVKIDTLISEDIHPVPATMDQEEVAFLFRQYGLVSAPVVDEAGRLIGVITVDDVVNVIDEEAEEDLLKLGGVSEDDIYRDVIDTTRSRMMWLGVNLVTAILASAVIALFESTIEAIVALAVLMPIVASMGGNAGTQSLTVAVRALAMKELTTSNAGRVVGKEVLVGALNGLLFALVAGGATWLWSGNVELSAVIGAAMIVNLVVAGFSGAIIPLALEKLGIDPAVASGVVLTTVTDVIGFFAFLGLAALVLL
ncbi:MAG: magnesium transporter [Inquilinus sp.]|nr:magnesium transporter [Inquilinus sp.]